MVLKPGELYWGLVHDAKPRPLVVVSREELNRGDWVTIVPLTSANFEQRSRLPTCVAFRAGESNLPVNCVAQADAITILTKSDLLLERGRIGFLSDEAHRDLIRAIGIVLSAECEPQAV